MNIEDISRSVENPEHREVILKSLAQPMTDDERATGGEG